MQRYRENVGMALVALVAGSFMIQGCGGDDAGPTAYTYGSTSNSGDLATWTLSGDSLTVEWKELDASGNVEMTFDVAATCAAAHPTYAYRTCEVSSASCTAGTIACTGGPTVGEDFKLIEIPGTALMVQSPGGTELSVGAAIGDCASLGTSDYTFVNVGLNQTDIFGMFRLDSKFENVTHMDFGWTGSGATPANRIQYATGSTNGQDTIPASTCSGGVRTVDTGPETIRVMITSGGFLIVDKPEGQGGLVAFKSSNAAALSDLASKSWAGISFPDNSAPEFISASSGAVSGSTVPLSNITAETSGSLGNSTIYSASAGPKLNETLEDNVSNPIANNPLYTTHGGPNQVPGVFELSSVGGEVALISIAGLVNGKVFMVGAVVNDRSGVNEMTGNFILFEK